MALMGEMNSGVIVLEARVIDGAEAKTGVNLRLIVR